MGFIGDKVVEAQQQQLKKNLVSYTSFTLEGRKVYVDGEYSNIFRGRLRGKHSENAFFIVKEQGIFKKDADRPVWRKIVRAAELSKGERGEHESL